MVIKILLMGDIGVGKSTVKNQYLGTKSDDLTLGLSQADIGSKNIVTENQTIKLQLWDVNSDFEKIMMMDTNIFTGVHGIVFVFDVTNAHSMVYIKKIHSELNTILNFNKTPIILIGNKTDLRNEFEEGAMHVSYETGQNLAGELSKEGIIFLKIPYFETSIEDPESYSIIFNFITTKLLGMFS